MTKNISIPVKGLHCKACEILTEDALKEIKNIVNVNVNHHTGLAEITYEGDRPTITEISSSLKKAGYEIGTENNSQKDKKDFSYFITIITSVLIVYWLINKSNVLDMGSFISGDFSWPLAIIVGLIAGVSTCLALVGGLVFSLAANYAKNHPEASSQQKFWPHILFNSGRILGFFLLGGLLGVLGSAFKMSVILNSIITIIIGLVIFTLGLKLLEIFPALNNFDFSLPKKFGNIIKINNPLLLGALTFFLPCGFTQAMQIYALGTGNFFEGGIIMALFALGTAPGLLGLGGINAILGKKKSKNFFVIAGIVVIAFGLFNLVNGFRLFKIASPFTDQSGYQLKSKEINSKKISGIEIENGVRIIRMSETTQGYVPDKFTLLKDQPVKWIISAEAPYSCASALVVPALKIQAQLTPGENIFEFTPNKTGDIKFSCSMGMYTGQFLIVDNETDLR